MKTRSTLIGGWRYRVRLFDWPLVAAVVFVLAATFSAGILFTALMVKVYG